jgi:hypothetical protein
MPGNIPDVFKGVGEINDTLTYPGDGVKVAYTPEGGIAVYNPKIPDSIFIRNDHGNYDRVPIVPPRPSS